MRPTLILPLLAACALFASPAQAAEQTRSVAAFTSVSNTGPISVRIEVGQPQSVIASGSDDFLADLQAEVVDGELRLRVRDGNNKHWNGAKVVITVPHLTAFTMAGAGETTITHMRGDSLAVSFSGAGNLKADGSVRNLTLDLAGVGSIDTRELHAESAKVNAGGVGSVKVWASEHLDASVGGVGSLTYYGDPKTVNTSGGGLGSISRAK
jgi:hypothetical protein